MNIFFSYYILPVLVSVFTKFGESQRTWVKRYGTPWTCHKANPPTDKHIHTHIHTYGIFRVTSSHNLHVIGLLKETGDPAGNLGRY